MTAFAIVSGVAGIAAFAVLVVQGVRSLPRSHAVLFTMDPARALEQARRACERRGLSYEILQGTAAGLRVEGRLYQLRSLRDQGVRESWLSVQPVSRMERR